VDQEPNAVRVQRSFQPSKGPRVLVSVVAVLLLLALVKPWGLWSNGARGGGNERGAASPVGSSPPLLASAALPPADPNAMDCFSGDTEQAVALERWPDNQVRTWVAIQDVSAAGPLDTRMPRIVIHSSHVVGIGVCASSVLAGPRGTGAWVRDVQSVVRLATGPKAVDLGSPDPITRDSGTPDGAELYGWTATGPSAVQSALPTPWPLGSYALAFTFPMDATQQVRWLRIDLVGDGRGHG
jgi:hypothetical protein